MTTEQQQLCAAVGEPRGWPVSCPNGSVPRAAVLRPQGSQPRRKNLATDRTPHRLSTNSI
jgi:hypothetical protein